MKVEFNSKSIWENYLVENKTCDPNNIESDVDIVIIGAGICGILCAYRLQNAGFNVIVLEKDKIGCGKTKNTTAFVSLEQDILYKTRIEKDGIKRAKQFFLANKRAIEEYEELAKKYDFDFEKVSHNIYTNSFNVKEVKDLKEEYDILTSFGCDCKINTIDDGKVTLLEVKNQAIINPIKLINSLAKNLKIYENTCVLNVKNDLVITDKQTIKAKKIIMCSGYPFINRYGMYYVKLCQMRSFVVAVKLENNKISDCYSDIDSEGIYFRPYKDYLIIGANQKRTGKICSGFNKINEFVKRNFPNSELKYAFSNIDTVSLDGYAYIGKYSNFKKNIFVATGFNLWGMTQSMIASIILTDLILEEENEFSKLFNPLRIKIDKQLFANLGNYISNLLKLKEPKCSHLGATLIYNDELEVFECPSHGSVFSIDGKVLNGPAKKNILSKNEGKYSLEDKIKTSKN